MDSLREPFRFAAAWALGASAVTATVDAMARALCLPPHWPPEYMLDCRGGHWAAAILRGLLDAGLTTILFFPIALLVGAATCLALLLVEERSSSLGGAVISAFVGLALWILATNWMEPSYLDFTVSGYAVAAGALFAAWFAGVARRTVMAT